MEQQVHNEVLKRLSVSNEIHKQLKLLAVAEGRPLQEMTEEFLRKGLEGYQKSRENAA